MKTILVPTDFSEAARNASEYAVQFAKEFGYKVLLCHIYHVPVLSVPEEPLLVMESQKTLQKNNMESLKEEVAILSKHNHNKVEITYRLKEGFAVDEILDIEKEIQPAFIVLGMKPAEIVSEFIVGSIAVDVIRKTKTPVLLIPEKATFNKIQRIALACDYKLKQETEEFHVLKELLEKSKAEFSIVNVGKEDPEKDAEKAIAGIRMQKYFEPVSFKASFIKSDDFTKDVNLFVKNNSIDLITMIPRKHNLLERIFKKSNTKEIAFHTTVPLLAIPEV